MGSASTKQIISLTLSKGSVQGSRMSNEDAEFEKYLSRHNSVHFAAVYDGHAGKHAADFCAKHLHENFDKLLSKHSDPLRVNGLYSAQRAFIMTDQQYYEHAKAGGYHLVIAGSTAACCAIDTATGRLLAANAGDAQCVLSRGGKALELSELHKPFKDVEQARIDMAGHCVLNGRLDGTLAVSRALGDIRFKSSEFTPPPPPGDLKFVPSGAAAAAVQSHSHSHPQVHVHSHSHSHSPTPGSVGTSVHPTGLSVTSAALATSTATAGLPPLSPRKGAGLGFESSPSTSAGSSSTAAAAAATTAGQSTAQADSATVSASASALPAASASSSETASVSVSVSVSTSAPATTSSPTTTTAVSLTHATPVLKPAVVVAHPPAGPAPASPASSTPASSKAIQSTLPPWKWALSPVPHVVSLDLEREQGDEFVLIGCDGLFDVMSPQDAVDWIRRRFQLRSFQTRRPAQGMASASVHFGHELVPEPALPPSTLAAPSSRATSRSVDSGSAASRSVSSPTPQSSAPSAGATATATVARESKEHGSISSAIATPAGSPAQASAADIRTKTPSPNPDKPIAGGAGSSIGSSAGDLRTISVVDTRTGDVRALAQELCHFAVRSGSKDNVSCIIIFLSFVEPFASPPAAASAATSTASGSGSGAASSSSSAAASAALPAPSNATSASPVATVVAASR